MVFCRRSDSDTVGIALQSEEPFSPRRKWSDMVTSFELTSSTHGEDACPCSAAVTASYRVFRSLTAARVSLLNDAGR